MELYVPWDNIYVAVNTTLNLEIIFLTNKLKKKNEKIKKKKKLKILKKNDSIINYNYSKIDVFYLFFF